MDKDARNIYKNARQTAGLTQERWAELLGISPDSVRRYEAGAMLPSDETVLMMAETTGILVLPLWHLRAARRAAAAGGAETADIGQGRERQHRQPDTDRV